MKPNYILIYGRPYLTYKPFERFEDISKFIEFILSLREIENEELQDKIAYFNKNVRRMWC